MRVLISGFEPSWGIRKTPSGELAKLWASGEISIEGVEVRSVVLPQVFGQSADMLWADVVAWKPHAILMFGAAQRNDPMRLERFAINIEKSPMGDNTRIPVRERPVVHSGPPAYECSLPIHWLVDRIVELGIDVKPSYHAGTHTCNSMFYHIMHRLSNHSVGHPVGAGFIHVSFPNEYGVIEDELWSTATFPGIVKASMALVDQVKNWYIAQHGDLP
jgi:pyroglutamyl-peptidase